MIFSGSLKLIATPLWIEKKLNTKLEKDPFRTFWECTTSKDCQTHDHHLSADHSNKMPKGPVALFWYVKPSNVISKVII